MSRSPEYRIWRGILRRCYNPRCDNYAYYGARGVIVAEEWLRDFATFYKHIGPRPTSTHSLDRFPNPTGNYEPGNVRWATPFEQARNKSGIGGLTFVGYQQKAGRTATYPGRGGFLGLEYCTLGLVGEAGETAEKVKKAMRDNGFELDAPTKKAILLELGDVMWYAARIATELGVGFQDVAGANLDKLASRKERGTIHGNGDNR